MVNIPRPRAIFSCEEQEMLFNGLVRDPDMDRSRVNPLRAALSVPTFSRGEQGRINDAALMEPAPIALMKPALIALMCAWDPEHFFGEAVGGTLLLCALAYRKVEVVEELMARCPGLGFTTNKVSFPLPIRYG
jgi:hypothetical protein